MMTLTINRKNRTIEMPSKKYAVAASKFGSDEYNEVQVARSHYPTYNVVTRKTSKRADTLRGLTYEVMESYITKHDKEGKIKKQYDFLRGTSEDSICPASYGEIKKWFLKTYPTFGKFPQTKADDNNTTTNIQ